MISLKILLTKILNAIASKQNTITGGASTITSDNLTASKALVSDSSGKVAVSAVTSVELGYLSGVTSNVQTQLDKLVHNISKQSGSTTSVASGTNTTIKSIALKAGRYLLIGSGSFPAGSGRCNLHFSMSGDSGEEDRYASVAIPLASNGVTRPQVMWTTTISTDGTSVYLIAYHTSGSTVSVSSIGVQVIPLDGGGIYAVG